MVKVRCKICGKTGYTASPDRLICKCGGRFKAMPQRNSGLHKTVTRVSLALIFCFILISSASAFSLNHIYSSKDGKVKLIIPNDAVNITLPAKPGVKLSLNASLPSTNIVVTRLSISGFSASSFPAKSRFLIAADFKPDRTVFKKDAILIFTLPQAEIPGTPIQLYYYNSKTKRFIAEGSPQPISKDGYTVIFKIRHFSSYAAFKGVGPVSTPIGTGVQIPLPDLLTGSFSHQVPINIPAGRKGMQPALNLTYHSSSTNSWTGIGWSLSPGFIVRSTRLGVPKYNDTQDTFYFVTDAGATELVYLTDNIYQAKIESHFSRFYKEANDSWRVVDKGGSVLRFGQTADSKEASTFGTYSWYLTKVSDTNGNYIEYAYSKDQGKSYLNLIRYTGHESGIAPSCTVEFRTGAREDVSSSYISKSRIVTALRLQEIQVRLNSDLVWRYVLDYDYSLDTNRSLLKSVIQYAGDGKNMPEQRFIYQRAK